MKSDQPPFAIQFSNMGDTGRGRVLEALQQILFLACILAADARLGGMVDGEVVLVVWRIQVV